jgi:hypothetical protein
MIGYIIRKLFGVNTPTIFLGDDTLYRIVELTNEWCEKNLGKNNTIGEVSIHIKDQGFSYKSNCGGYDIETNTIYIYRDQCDTIEWIIKSLIHEYTHYTQDLRNYDLLLEEYGYRNHPQEIEANNMMNNYYLTVWNKIKNKI